MENLNETSKEETIPSQIYVQVRDILQYPSGLTVTLERTDGSTEKKNGLTKEDLISLLRCQISAPVRRTIEFVLAKLDTEPWRFSPSQPWGPPHGFRTGSCRGFNGFDDYYRKDGHSSGWGPPHGFRGGDY